MLNETHWTNLRSNIYIRDKGICWICNMFVQLSDYDLGHLIDRHNGGHDDYDNLAVMHKICNLQKPSHNTLDEALKWKLTFNIPLPTIKLNNNIPHIKFKRNRNPNRITSTYIKPSILNKRKLTYEEHISKIIPGTICWKQGKPFGGNVWKVLPPPYKQDNLFSMRELPPNAIDKDYLSAQESIQIIGKLPDSYTKTINLNIGIVDATIDLSKDKPTISLNLLIFLSIYTLNYKTGTCQ